MNGQNKDFKKDLTTGNVTKTLLLFATPLFLSGALQTAYNIVDMVVVGHFIGSTGLSAVTIGGDVLTLLTFVAMGFSGAGQTILSQYIGAHRYDCIGRIIGTMSTSLFIGALSITAGCIVFIRPLLQWLNTPASAFAYTRDYVLVCCCGLIFIYGYNLVSAILRGLGDSLHPLLFITVATVINLLLDIIFVAGLRLGVMGAALATVIGQGVSFLWAAAFLYRRRTWLGFDFRWESLHIDEEFLIPLLKLGIPMILQSAAITISKLAISSWVNVYGVILISVTGIGNKLATFANVFSQAFSTAGGAMIAQNIGAEKYKRVPEILRVSLIAGGIVAGLFSAVTVLYPNSIYGLFTNENQVIEAARLYSPVAVLMYISSAVRPPMNALINGSGNAKLNLLIAVLDGIILRICLAAILGFWLEWGIYGFWYGNAIAGFVPFFIGGIFYLSGRWRRRSIWMERDKRNGEKEENIKWENE